MASVEKWHGETHQVGIPVAFLVASLNIIMRWELQIGSIDSWSIDSWGN